MEENCDSVVILPDEIFSMILKFNNVHDIIQFGTSCKRFHNLVKNDQVLWKIKMKEEIPIDMFSTLERHSDGDWLNEVVMYYKQKCIIFAELASSTVHTHNNEENTRLENQGEEYTQKSIRKMVLAALSNSYSLYYTIHILQTAIEYPGKIVRNLTDYEIIHAKYCLRHLLHLYLVVKWFAGNELIRNDLTPGVVVNLFVQWVDTDHLYHEDKFELEIQKLIKTVNLMVQAEYPKKYTGDVKESLDKGKITERQILEIISKLIYKDLLMRVTGNAELQYLIVDNVMLHRHGNVVVVAAIYQTLASRCGVNCKLNTFSNHLFLEWEETIGTKPEFFTIDLATGELRIKRRCPYSHSSVGRSYIYCPESLIEYLHSSFHGSVKNNMHAQNALRLLKFVGGQSPKNEYGNLLPVLLEPYNLPVLQQELSLQYLSESQLHLLTALAMTG